MRPLLDTCALLWYVGGIAMTPASIAAIRKASAKKGGVAVSAITAWELPLLARKSAAVSFDPDPAGWWRRATSSEAVEVFACTDEVLLLSQDLPGRPPNDPADRIVIATARLHDCTVVTRDRLILAYAKAGHVKAMPC